MDSERAETYLRDFAEAELRRLRRSRRGGHAADLARVRAVASAYATLGALDPDRAESIVEYMATALAIRSTDRPAIAFDVHEFHRGRRAAPAPPGSVSVAPIGRLLELRDGDTDVDVYLLGAVIAPDLVCLSTGVLGLPTGSRPRRHACNPGLRRQAPSRFAGMITMSGIPRDLMAMDDNGLAYDLLFSGAGFGAWHAGHFSLMPTPPGFRRSVPPAAAWLDVGSAETSVRVDLTAGPLSAAVTVMPAALSGERIVRVRADALIANLYLELSDGLPALTALIPALRAAGELPGNSMLPGQISALCKRYAVPANEIADPPARLPDRWASVLAARDRADAAEQPYQAGGHAAAADLYVEFPESDRVIAVLSGLVTSGERTTLHGAFFGSVEPDYLDGPSIWMHDDTGQWHVATPGNWSDGGVVIFAANVTPPLTPAVTAVDILMISQTADLSAAVPLNWWTS